jgi:hypothetical protein
MRTFTIESQEITIPDIKAVRTDPLVFQIMEGECGGIQFILENMKMDDEDVSIMHYDLNTIVETDVDKIKPIVDNFIVSIFHDQIERSRNENDQKCDSDT